MVSVCFCLPRKFLVAFDISDLDEKEMWRSVGNDPSLALYEVLLQIQVTTVFTVL